MKIFGKIVQKMVKCIQNFGLGLGPKHPRLAGETETWPSLGFLARPKIPKLQHKSKKATNKRIFQGQNLAVGTHQGHCQIWDVEAKKRVLDLEGHAARIGCLG